MLSISALWELGGTKGTKSTRDCLEVGVREKASFPHPQGSERGCTKNMNGVHHEVTSSAAQQHSHFPKGRTSAYNKNFSPHKTHLNLSRDVHPEGNGSAHMDP